MTSLANGRETKRSKQFKVTKPWSILFGTVVIFAAAFALDFWTYPLYTDIGGRSFNQSENGLWLRYLWYFGKYSPEELQSMLKRLNDYQVRYAYFHVRGLNKEGELEFHNPAEARRLADAVHSNCPSAKVVAWVYIGSNVVDISAPKLRRRMIEEAKWLIEECRFDGIQWDYEFALNEGDNLISLLKESRAAFPKSSLISVATPMWYPGTLWGWSSDYFGKVAANCDQVAVMCYDSFFYLPRSYVWLVKQQCINVSAAVWKANKKCRLLLGVPTYNTFQGTLGHHGVPECIKLALKGVREGMSDPKAAPEAFAGVSPFADYTTDDDEWQTYRALWLR